MRTLWRIPLSIWVALLAAALMVVLGVVASQQVLATLDRLQDARVRELAKLRVESLSVALGPHVLREDVWEVYDRLERASGESEGRRIMFTAVADEDGRVMAATDPARAPLDSAVAELAMEAERPAELTLGGDAPALRLSAPLVYQGRLCHRRLQAGLTIYDMVKAVDRGMEISDIRLLSKAGGKSGRWHNEQAEIAEGKRYETDGAFGGSLLYR